MTTPFTVFLVTVSSSRARAETQIPGSTTDATGAALAAKVAELGGRVLRSALVADEIGGIQRLAREGALLAQVVVFAGGTGVAPSDLTPEALEPLFERKLPGFGECMRAHGARNEKVGLRAYLSRSVAGMIGRALVLAVPGSPGGACDSFAAVAPLLDHVTRLAAGGVGSCQDELGFTARDA